MPLLLLGIPAILGVGALAYDKFTSKTDELMTQQTPNVLAVGALVIAGLAVYATMKGRK